MARVVRACGLLMQTAGLVCLAGCTSPCRWSSFLFTRTRAPALTRACITPQAFAGLPAELRALLAAPIKTLPVAATLLSYHLTAKFVSSEGDLAAATDEDRKAEAITTALKGASLTAVDE